MLVKVRMMPWADCRAGGQAASRRFRCTSSSEIAAGVTPLTRAAWPTVAGRARFSFSSTSADSPRTLS